MDHDGQDTHHPAFPGVSHCRRGYSSEGEFPMRLALTLTAVLMIATRVNADDSGNATKQPPTDDKIIAQVGGRLVKVFAQVGMPEDLEAGGDYDGGGDLRY